MAISLEVEQSNTKKDVLEKVAELLYNGMVILGISIREKKRGGV